MTSRPLEQASVLTGRETAKRSLVHGAHNRIRTDDLVLTKNALCRLSYVGQYQCRRSRGERNVAAAALVVGTGFEPVKAVRPPILQTGAIVHSAIPPWTPREAAFRYPEPSKKCTDRLGKVARRGAEPDSPSSTVHHQ